MNTISLMLESIRNFSLAIAFLACTKLVAARIEIPTLQWGDSKRPDGTTRHWNPEPLIDLKTTLVCVAYRPLLENGDRWNAVGMTPPKLLAKTLLNTKPELDECHQHSIKVIGYADTIMFHPSMLEPEGIKAEELYAIDRHGKRVMNTMWDKTGAGVSCVENPQWVELQKQVAVTTAKFGYDGLQFDVYPYAIDPGYLCCCDWCKEAWSKHSRRLFGKAQPMPGLDSGKLDFRKSVDRAFKVWRLQSFVDFVKTIETHVRRTHSRFIIIMNHGAGTPDYTYETSNGGLRYPSSELWHLKLGDDSSLYIYSSTEAANGARAIGLINFADQMKPDYRYRVALAEAFAGGGTFYAATGSRKEKGPAQISHDYCDFFRNHQEWFNDTHSDAEVAVLYSWRDQAFLQGDPVADAKVDFDPKRNHYQQAAAWLSRMGVPNDCLIVEKGLTQRELSRYKIIVAPDLSLVTERDAKALEKYVRNGGRLLSIGKLGDVTEAGQGFVKRPQSLFMTWLDGELRPGESAPFGKGMISSHAKEFSSASGSTGFFAQTKIQSATPIETTIRAKGRQRSIHIIRFGPTDKLTDRTVTLNYTLPKGREAKAVSVWSPDSPIEDISFSWKTNAGELQIIIDSMESYALVGVTLK